MRYMVPYTTLLRELMNGGSGLTEEQVMPIIRKLLRAVDVDEERYRKLYPDVAAAIDVGRFKSARDHFIANGYFEGREPFGHEIDEEWYMGAYPDIAEQIESGALDSPLDHYIRHGYKEGRLPSD